MSFAESRLPKDPLIEKAWSLVSDNAGAVISAQVLAEEMRSPDAETIAAHLVAFASRKEWTAEKIAAEFTPRVSDIVEGVRAVYDKLGGKPAASPDDAVKLSFLAVGITVLEDTFRYFQKSGIDDVLISAPQEVEPGKVRIVQSSVRHELETARDAYAPTLLPLAGTTSEPALEQRFARIADSITTKLTTPKPPKPARDSGFSFGM